jgi:hypothetical protein
MIGLGTTYNYDSFGAQFCLSRNAANPILSVRYKESNAWRDGKVLLLKH